MRHGTSASVLLGLVCLVGLPVTMHAQAPPIANQAPKKCKANSKDPACQAAPSSSSSAPSSSPAAENPFPVEESRHGGDAEGTPPPSTPAPSANGLPALPTGNDADPPAESNKPRKIPKEGYTTGGDDSSSSDASSPVGGASSSRSNDDDDVAPTTEAPDAPVKASKLKDLGSSGSTSAARAKLEATRFDDDLKVGKFYLQDGNPQGAYLRYKDAVAHVPDDPDALFGLAQAADKLKKRDEAVANYRAAIKADPGGDHDKASRAALKQLGAASE